MARADDLPLPPSPVLAARELAAVAVGSLLLAVVMFWPLVLHLGSELPKDLGDPLSQAWQLAWDGHALVHQPLRFFDANQFWPGHDTLALSDALVGYAPLAVPGTGVRAAVVRYDVVFLMASALATAGPYLLARELGLPRAASCVTAVAFAYAPWRLEQGGHLHVLSSGAIALAAFLLVRGHRRAVPWMVLAGWAALAWQVSIGFSLGLPLLLLVALAAAAVARGWWRRGRPSPAQGIVRATVAGAALLAVVTVVLAVPYLRVRSGEPQSRRTPQTVAVYSAGPKMFLTASALNPIWGPVTARLRRGLPAVPEQTLFPGLVALVLAIAGGWWRGWPRRLRRLLGGATAVFALLSLGFEAHGVWSVMPYRALYEWVPGWSGMRVPERMNTFTSLALALLAGAGAARLAAWRRGPALVVLAAVLVLVEGAGFGPGRFYPHLRAPLPPPGLAHVPAPLLQLPVSADDNRRYLLWSTEGLRPMVNGRSSIEPQRTRRILAQLSGFPDARSVRALRLLGVRSVVLHADRVEGTAWQDWRGRATTGLGMRVVRRGPLVVYELA